MIREIVFGQLWLSQPRNGEEYPAVKSVMTDKETFTFISYTPPLWKLEFNQTVELKHYKVYVQVQ